MTKVAILDYGAGNLASVDRAVRHLGADGVVTRDRNVVRDAERVIFPGVGAAGASMESLRELGLAEEILHAREAGKPILGICIGCQVIFTRSEEDGGVSCLGLLPGKVERFKFPEGVERKIPHMGWNEVRFTQAALEHPVFGGIEAGDQFYFVHSYHVKPEDPSIIAGSALYGEVRFVAAIAKENLVAVQFHTEKSGRAGLKILENFLGWTP